MDPKGWAARLVLLGVVMSLSMVLTLNVGVAKIGPVRAFKIVLNHAMGEVFERDWTESEELILTRIRLPRLLLAAIVGAALSISGAVFQALLRNPLADPYVLGISSGSALGAAVAILLGSGSALLGGYALPAFPFLGGLATICLVYLIAGTSGRAHPHTMLLSGVIVGSFFSALLMFIISISQDERLHSIMFWLMGDLSTNDMRLLKLILVYVSAGILLTLLYAKDLNLLMLGEEQALELGANVRRVRAVAFLSASLITGAAVSVSGLIGFVGLIIPHIVRMAWGADLRFVLPASCLLGATYLIAADAISRVVLAPAELPVGVITALCGAPFFVHLLKKKALERDHPG